MIRHPHFLEIPWDFHPAGGIHRKDSLLWWVIIALLLAALCLIGISFTGSIAE
jgi:hypothetical protein